MQDKTAENTENEIKGAKRITHCPKNKKRGYNSDTSLSPKSLFLRERKSNFPS